MKKLFLVFLTVCLATMLQAAVSKTVNLTTAGTLSTVLTATDLTTVTDLTLSGNIDARDFVTLRDKMTVLANIDMSAATVMAYTGTGGTEGTASVVYAANVFPNDAFYNSINYTGKSSLKSIKLPITITSIGMYAFCECSGLGSISIPSSVTLIRFAAFAGCSTLKSVSIPNSVMTIANDVFDNCKSLTTISLPSSIVAIGDNTFARCSALSSIIIPNSVTYIGNNAFGKCSSLTTISISRLVTYIGDNAFYGCSGLSSIKAFNLKPVVLPSSFVFYIVDKSIPLYVPVGSKAAYAAADYWKDFTNIIEFDHTVATIANTAGGLASALSAQLSTVKTLTITGTIDARDFKTIRDLTPLLTSVDLSGASIVAYTGTEGTVSSLITYLANEVPIEAFRSKGPITTVRLPSSTTAINDQAFQYCTMLSSFDMPPLVTKIGTRAFESCPSIQSMTIPAFVRSIDICAFMACSGLPSFTVNPNNSSYSTINGVLCNKAQTQIVSYPGGQTGDYSIPASITSIGSYAFAYSKFLSAVSIPSTVKSIASGAFYSCGALTSIRAYSGTPIDIYSSPSVFTSVSKTIPLFVPTGTTALYAAADQWKDFTNILEMPDIAAVKLTTAGSLATVLAGQMGSIAKLTLTGNIDARDFKTMRDLMPKLTEVDLSGATVVAYTGVDGTNGATSQTYPANTIPDAAFKNKTSLTSIVMPNSITAIGDNVYGANYGASFQGCTGLTSVTIPSKVTLIGISSFFNCTNLSSVTIPNSVTTIGMYAFQNCAALTEITIPSSVSLLDYAAFYACSGLLSFTIPSTVTKINGSAFGYCSGLQSIISYSTTPLNLSSSPNVFTNVTKTIPLYVPAGTKALYAAANQWKDFTNIVEFYCNTGKPNVLAKEINSTITLDVTANTSWLATTTDSWLSISPSLATIGSGTITLTANSANTGPLRTATITLAAAGVPTKTIPVMQEGISVNLSANALAVSKLANSTAKAPITVTANTGWQANTMATWFKVATTSTSINAITTQDNPSVDPRTDTIKVIAVGLPTQLIVVTQAPGDATLSLTPTLIVLSKESGSSNTVAVTSNTAWTPATTDAWLTVSAGKTGAGTLTITANTANPNDVPRSGSVTVSVAGLPVQTIEVWQVANPMLTLSGTAVSVGKAATSQMKVSVTSNTTWTATTTASWLTVSPNVATQGSASLSFTAATANPLVTPRTALVTVSAKGVTPQTITVTQDGGDPSLTVASATATVAKQALSKTTVAVTANTTWTASSSAKWLSVSNSTDNAALITLTALEVNPSIVARIATATLSSTANGVTVTKVITVTQAAGDPTLVVAASTATVAKTATSKTTLGVTTNATWTALSNQKWLTVSSSADNAALVTITANETNPTIATRVATVTLSATANGVQVMQTITVTQDAGDPILSVQSTMKLGAKLNNSGSILVTSNTTWKISKSSKWLQLNTAVANGTTSFSVFALENTTIVPRVDTIRVSATGLTDRLIVVTQDAAPAWLMVSKTAMSFAAIPTAPLDQQLLTITSNAKWTVNSSALWATASVATGTDSATITIKATENTFAQVRTASITVTGVGGLVKTVSITQAAAIPTLSIEYTKKSLNTGVDSVEVRVISNTKWEVMTESPWILFDINKGSGNGSFTFIADSNAAPGIRTTKIMVTAMGANSQYIEIPQAGNVVFKVEPSEVEVAAKDTVLNSVRVISNVEYIILTPPNVDWISASPFVEKRDTMAIQCKLKPNTSITPRSVTLDVIAIMDKTHLPVTITQKGDTTLSVSVDPISFAAGKDTLVRVVKSNTNWTASSTAPWLTTKANADSGNAELSIIAQANNTITERSAYIIVYALGAGERRILVTQAAGLPFLNVPATARVSANTDTATTILVETNIPWKAVTIEDWITFSPEEANGETTITIAAVPNTSINPRTGIIKFKAGTISKTLSFTQGGDTILTVANDIVSVGKEGMDLIVPVTSNTTWSSTASAEWLTAKASVESGNGTVSIKVAANSSLHARTAKVKVWNEGVTREIAISQDGDTVLTVNNSPLLFSSKLDSLAIAVTSNTKWKVSSSAKWLQPVVTSDSASATFTLRVLANAALTQRQGTITVSAKGAEPIVIDVTQEASPKFVSVPAKVRVAAKLDTSASVEVLSNIAWTAKTLEDWFTITPEKGTEDGVVVISANKNTNIAPRTGLIYFKSAVADQIIEFTQGGDTILTVANDVVSVGKEGMDLIVPVISNIAWTSSSSAEWVVSTASVASGDGLLAIKVATNPTTQVRTATVNVTAAGVSPRTISITQAAGDTVSTVSETTIAIGKDANSVAKTTITSNTVWAASSSQEWLNVSLSGANFDAASATVSFDAASATTTALWFVAATNTSISPRTATVVVASVGVADKYITITQAAGDTILNLSSLVAQVAAKVDTTTSIAVTSNTAWTVSADQTWVSLSANAGTGNQSFTIAAPSNLAVEARTANVTVKAVGAKDQVIALTQLGNVLLSVTSPTENAVSKRDTTIVIAVSANTSWTATPSADWLIVSANNETASVHVLANNTVTTRTASVTILAGTITKVVSFTQAAGDTVLSAASTTITAINTTNNVASVEVTTNVGFTASSNQEWLQVALSGTDLASASSTVSFSTASKTTTAVWFVAASNTTAVERSAQVAIVTATGKQEVITITQAGVPTLAVSATELSVLNAINDTARLTITSNTQWSVSCPATWLTITKASNGLVYVSTTALNPTVSSRTAQVTVTVDGLEPQIITVSQAAGLATLKVAPTTFQVAAHNDTAIAFAYSNTSWTISATAPWITTRISGDSIICAVAANPTTSSRSEKIAVMVAGLEPQVITITQDAGAARLSVPATASISAAANSTASVAVSSNTAWTALVINGGDWLTIDPASLNGNRNADITFSAKANPSNAVRTATIMVSADGVKAQTITVTQAAGTGVDASEANAESITIYPNPTTAYFTVNTSAPASVAVYTQAGALLVSTTATSKDQIMLDAFAAGTYIVKVTTPAGVTEHKLIKQ